MRRAKTIVYFLSALLLAGCERDAAEEVSPADGEHPLLFTATIAGGDSGGLSVGTRTGEEVEDIPVKELDETRNALLKKTFTKGDAIRISNVASGSASANFDLNDPHCFQYVYEKHNHVPGDDTDDPTYVEGSMVEDQYAQEHFNPLDPSDGWSEYLFKPETVDDTERGFYLSNLITDGNSYFRFYACLYKDAYGNSLPVVKTDQSKEEDFLNSDALFAHTGHHIKSVDEPIRLIFYHAHAMLDVRLVLPVYDKGYQKTSDSDPTPERLPSGYKEDDVRLVLTNVKTDYRIAWAMQSDAGKMVPTTFDDDVDRVKEIPMYRYYVEEGDGHMEKDSDDTESESSEYRTYGYCAIVPYQDDNFPIVDPQTATYLPLLRLYVKNPITGEKESYVYIPDNKPVGESKTGFSLEQGKISVLYLKLSRTANDRLTVMGDIQQWDRASGSMEALKDEGQDKAAGKQEG